MARVDKLHKSIQDKLDFLGVDPLISLVRVAAQAEVDHDIQLQAKIYGQLMEYVYPKLRSIEHSGEAGGITVIIDKSGVPPLLDGHKTT